MLHDQHEEGAERHNNSLSLTTSKISKHRKQSTSDMAVLINGHVYNSHAHHLHALLTLLQCGLLHHRPCPEMENLEDTVAIWTLGYDLKLRLCYN